MFNNIGKKIKTLAKVICWLGIIGSIITGIVLIAVGLDDLSSRYSSDEGVIMIVAGLLTMVVGSIISWVGSFKLYGFGDVVDNVQAIRYRVVPEQILQQNVYQNNVPWSAENQNVRQ